MIESLSTIDNLILILYIGIALVIGLISAVGRDKTTQDYFLAGKDMGWILIGTSLFATNISSEHFIGLAGAGSVHGLSVGLFEWLAVFILIILAWFFIPVFIKADVMTMPEFLGKKFGDRVRAYLTAISLAAYFFTKIAVTLIAGGYLLGKILGLDVFTSAVLIVLLTGLYTVIGGMASVMKTQFFQAIVLIVGSLLLTLYGLKDIGGLSVIIEKLPASYFEIIKSSSDPNFPWTGILFGAPILGIWYWCTDQYIVQRILSARNIREARKGTFLAAFLKIIPIFLLIIPGLVAAIKYPNIKGDAAFTYLVTGDLLPTGIKGIVIAGLIAALMSSLASAFNSSAALISIDIFKPMRPRATESEIVLVGRLSTIMIVVFAIILIPLLKVIDSQIYLFLQQIQAYISPPIASAFLFGIFWSKSTSKGVFTALIFGGIVGFVRIIISMINPTLIGEFPLFHFLNGVHYLHFAVFLFLLTSFVLIVVSLNDKKIIISKSKSSEDVELENEMKHRIGTKEIEKFEIIEHK
ncbi:MAG: hypothetical protein CVV23_11655 [Ignavibacteriae bacterium HGW-Ignavibacteriae-2]|nr:sodium/solute symporter [Bacteroidota bacterium]PKL88180.1 MAG: hypothetical protein CVV23_11655 [Ignavibacteriae bacterium HGW-Ignavibacteriae-2]